MSRVVTMLALTATIACGSSPTAPTEPTAQWPALAPLSQTSPIDLTADGPAHITDCGPASCSYLVTIRNRGNACMHRVSGRLTVLGPDGSELAFHEWALPSAQRLGPFGLVSVSATDALPRAAALGGTHYRMGFAWEYFTCAVISSQ